jgi:hypothetical protein
MILSEKPKKVEQQELPLEVPKTNKPIKKEEWVCYFLEHQKGPKGFEDSTLLTFSFEWNITGFSEDLKLTLDGNFHYDKENHRFFLKESAVTNAKKLAAKYRYTIAG